MWDCTRSPQEPCSVAEEDLPEPDPQKGAVGASHQPSQADPQQLHTQPLHAAPTKRTQSCFTTSLHGTSFHNSALTLGRHPTSLCRGSAQPQRRRIQPPVCQESMKVVRLRGATNMCAGLTPAKDRWINQHPSAELFPFRAGVFQLKWGTCFYPVLSPEHPQIADKIKKQAGKIRYNHRQQT